ncbi:MAG: RidA family protein [Cytophagales bacterium]|nr:RidA family protein [Cytophagales bacterium]
MAERTNLSSGAPWEAHVGYSRAVRIGNTIEISGTAPVKDGQTMEGTPYEQAVRCLEIIQESLEKLGSGLKDVIRTRMFVTDISQWEAIGRAHGEFFKDINPATSMVEVSQLIDERMVVEIEATAIVQ